MTDDLHLFDPPEPDRPDLETIEPNRTWPRARARRTDPDESHAAARSVTDLTGKQTAVLELLSRPDALSDVGLVEEYRRLQADRDWPVQSESGLRTRRAELVSRELVERIGTIRLPSGRNAATWRAVQHDQR